MKKRKRDGRDGGREGRGRDGCCWQSRNNTATRRGIVSGLENVTVLGPMSYLRVFIATVPRPVTASTHGLCTYAQCTRDVEQIIRITQSIAQRNDTPHSKEGMFVDGAAT